MGKRQHSIIESVDVQDIRFRFPELGHGSDAINPHTDYSNPLVTIRTSHGEGTGIGFSLGLGNDMICQAIRELAPLVIGTPLEDLVFGFGELKWLLANPIQSRWIAPNAGPYYMGAGAIMNAVFDAWAKSLNKPLWAALAELAPDDVLDMIDFRYVEHYLGREDARRILVAAESDRAERLAELRSHGLPSYFTTWIGSDTDDLVEQIGSVRKDRGVSGFKLKVGSDRKRDRERLGAVRDSHGGEVQLYTDANQVWSADEAISWMSDLVEFSVTWIEEPTAPDSISGHRCVREGLRDTGIEVVSGENCPNPQLAAQFIGEAAVDRFQIDACRMMGPPDVMLVMLIASRYGVPVCPHAGGSGLDELVPHLAAWNYLCCAPTLDRVVVEQVGFCSRYFEVPSQVVDGRIVLPETPGYLVGMRQEAIDEYRYPDGPAWRHEMGESEV